MDDADQVRDRGTRLLALALQAREDSHFDYAEELTKLAEEALAQADEMERKHRNPREQFKAHDHAH